MLALLVMAGATLSACSPTPEPSPTPTAAFASEEEAFAAAEEVYRAYTDAINSRIAGADTPDPQDYLTGLALESDIETAELFRANDVHLEGEATVASFSGKTVKLDTVPQSVVASTCMDATNSRVINGAGEDVTPPSRPDISALEVTFITVGNDILISDSVLAEDDTC